MPERPPQIDPATLKELTVLLDALYEPNEAMLWLFSPQPFAKGRIPAQMILDGDADDALAILERACHGAYI